ncbi:MAG: hypothetical protein DPW18_20705 [Chloroflexi bacterium]|nr:MmcQ/YjbR family DNA-binding protein [Chloroflexota bacterium]MCQ3939440.1 hypothetical protein [Chloroflexota bacterium]MDL1883608.1 MmcQ/YjbR family DNA-binding protein [Anaerolineae bacterium CFX8]
MSEERYNPGHKTALDQILLAMPGVRDGKAFGYPAYKVSGKVFAFIGGMGMALKLPEGRVHELLQANPTMKPFEPTEGVFWREWVSIDHADPSAYEQYESLFAESIRFVTGGEG